MKTRVFVGWMGKEYAENPNTPVDGMVLEEVYTTQGTRKNWSAENWPPRKVRITVEEVK